jgi:hypothetical protein
MPSVLSLVVPVEEVSGDGWDDGVEEPKDEGDAEGVVNVNGVVHSDEGGGYIGCARV